MIFADIEAEELQTIFYAIERFAIHEAIARKPKGHDFIIDRRHTGPAVQRHMSVTGG